MSVLDQSIYDALVIAAQNMKNPSEMQLLEVTIMDMDENEHMKACIVKLQSTTSLGAVNTDEMLLTSSGTTASLNSVISGWSSYGNKIKSTISEQSNATEYNVNVKKINSALKKHWKDLGIE